MPTLNLSESARLALVAAEAGLNGVAAASLPVRLRMSADSKIDAPGVTRFGDRWFATEVLDAARSRLLAVVKAHHGERPLDPGAPREDVRSRIGADAALFDQLVASLVATKQLETDGAHVRLPGRSSELSGAQQKIADELLATLTSAGREPPSVSELETRFGKHTLDVLRHLERQKRVIQVEDGRYYAPDAVRELLQRLEKAMAGKGEVAPTDLREGLGFSRKYLIPFLEYCDKRGYTQRQGNGRVWKGGSSLKA